ncbi:RDD family protein [Chryseobacterium sp. CT-SW4]|uniref:RDD family protein n=1 Tax=Chryseobacterium sp. SW-1 TaxID=3157343 RepID=UPI003B0295FF
MRKYLQVVDRHKASKVLRLINYFIDLFFNFIIISVLFGILGLLYSLVSGIPFQEVAYMMENVNPLLDRLVTLLTYAFLMFSTETITGGRSLGKLLTGTQVIMIDGTRPKAGNYFLRNIIRCLPFIDQLSFLGENGFHDAWSETRVVVKKHYEAELRAKDDINSIGTKEIV